MTTIVLDDTTQYIECPHCLGPIDVHTVVSTPIPPPRYTQKPHLSIVCITRGDPHAAAFISSMRDAATSLNAEFVIGADGYNAFVIAQDYSDITVSVQSSGYVESVLNKVILAANGIWVLRLDDDEEISPALFAFLRDRRYTTNPLWRIPTMALWGDTSHYITNPPLFPDAHLRLTTWKYRGGWADAVHAPAPHQTDNIAPAAILHHKYLLKSLPERQRVAARYEQLKPGGGYGVHAPFTIPEVIFGDKLTTAPVGDGSTPTASTTSSPPPAPTL